MKQLSRQRLWQLAHEKKGLCILCSNPMAVSCYCQKHREAESKRMRKRRETDSVYREYVREYQRQRQIKKLLYDTTSNT